MSEGKIAYHERERIEALLASVARVDAEIEEARRELRELGDPTGFR